MDAQELVDVCGGEGESEGGWEAVGDELLIVVKGMDFLYTEDEQREGRVKSRLIS